MRLLSQTFKALSDARRLEILALLFRHGELCACDVEATLGLPPREAAHELRHLVATGLVQSRSDGAWMHYRIADHTGPEQQLVLEAVRALLSDVLTVESEDRYGRWMAKKTGRAPVRPTQPGH
jgi:ArsR family transcriptional regulator, arsenate/arsenite/antimonite-responsive transcriptional repressor